MARASQLNRLLALIAVSAVLTGCARSSSPATTTSVTPTSTMPALASSSTTAPPFVDGTSVPGSSLAPPAGTLKPGQVPTHADESEPQPLSDRCTTAVEPLRRLMRTYASGLQLQSPDDVLLGRYLGEATLDTGSGPPCEAAEWDRFYKLEFDGWLTP